MKTFVVKKGIFLLILFTKLFIAHSQNYEKISDSLYHCRQFTGARDNLILALKNNKKTFADSLRILFKLAETDYVLNETTIFKNRINEIEKILKTHPGISDNDKLSYVEFIKAKYYENVNKYDSAMIETEIAEKIRAKVGKDSLYAAILNMKGSYYYNLNNYNNAILYYKLAVYYFIKNRIYDDNIIRILLNEAYLYWLQTDLNQYKKIIDIALKYTNIIPVSDYYKILVYQNAGAYYLQKSDYFNSYMYFDKLFQLKSINKKDYFQSLNYLAYNLKVLGDYIRALNVYNNLLIQKQFLSHQTIADIYNEKAMCHYYLNDLDSSLIFIKKTINYCKKENLNLKFKQLWFNSAMVYYKKSNHDSALFYINKAIKEFKKNDLKILDAIILMHKGKILNNDSSNFYFNEAQKLILNLAGIKNSRTSYLFNETGLFRFENKKYREALHDFQQALVSVDRDFNSTNIFDNPECKNILSIANVAKALRYKSECLEQLYLQTDSLPYLIASYQTARLLTAQIEKMLTSYPLFESRNFLIENTIRSFRRAQWLSYQCLLRTGDKSYKTENLLMSEKSRTAILNTEMHDKLSGETLSGTTLNELNQTEQQIAYVTGQINENPGNTELVTRLNANLFELQEKKNRLLEQNKGEYGNFSNFFAPQQELNAAELFSYPAQNEVVLEYSLCDSIILLNAFGKNRHEIVAICYDSLLMQQMQSFGNFLVSGIVHFTQTTQLDSMNRVGQFLYNKLLAPVQDMITGNNLLIIQDTKTGFLPFEAFSNNGKYVIETNAVSYLFSLQTTLESLKIPLRGKNKMAGFFPAYNPAAIDSTYPAAKYYKQLPGLDNEKEPQNTSAIAACDTFTAENATEASFRNLVSQYQLLHLSLHSILDTNNFLASKLCFTATKDSSNDGIFNICDMPTLHLNSALTVLSGCNTVKGKAIEGEGVMSFARNFILAGSRSILMSLWEIDSQTSMEITDSFYKYLAEGYNKAEALRLAKTDYLHNTDAYYSHPFFWAGMVVIGDPQPIEVPQPAHILNIVLLIFAILSAIFGIMFYLRKKYGICLIIRIRQFFTNLFSRG